MARTLSPEFRLVAACAMWPSSDSRLDLIRKEATEAIVWPHFLRLATRHQVIGLVHDGLTRAQVQVPAETASRIGETARALASENLTLAHESLRLQQLFDNANVSVCFIKGAALAALAFDNLGLRAGQDIDLLVHEDDLHSATYLLVNAGYRRYDPPPEIDESRLKAITHLRKDFGFVHSDRGVRIELHWRLFLNPYALTPPNLTLPALISLGGAAKLRTLGEEDNFAYLCLHGALHWWNRLKWLADINALLAARSDYDIQRLVRSAHSRGAGRAATQAILLCREVLKAPIPSHVMATLENSTAIRVLVATAIDAMTSGQGLSDPHATRFGTTRGSLSTFLLRNNWRYRLAELQIHLFNPGDVLTLSLPTQLQFLHPFARLPLWIWRQVGKPRSRK